MFKKIFFLIFLVPNGVWAQKTGNSYEKLYQKVVTEIAATDLPQALKIADSMVVAATSPELKGRSVMLKAILYMQQSKNDESIRFAEEAKEILDSSQNYELQAKIRGLLATEYRVLGLYKKSGKYADEGSQIADKIDDEKKQAQVKALFLQEKAYYERNLKRYGQAIHFLKESLIHLSKIPEDKMTLGKTYQFMGENYLELHDYKSTDVYNLEALKILPETFIGYILSTIGLGISKARQGKYHEAEAYLLKGLKFAETADYPQAKKLVYNALAGYYDQVKQYDKANFYNKKYVDTLNKTEDKFKNTIDENYDKIDNEKEQYASGNITRNIFIIIFFIFIVWLTVIFMIYKRKQKEKYFRFKNIINHYKEKKENVVEDHMNASEVREEQIFEKEDIDNKQLGINGETEAKILSLLEVFEREKMFNQGSVSLSFLASEFDTNVKYISYVVKKYKNTDFKNYVNTLRVDYIIHKLKTSEKYRKYKIGALAEECGFSSHGQFATTFKSITGTSPSTFISFIDKAE
ncbi:helix-turn-helix domain-containing protein [Chryseobacterium sp. MYb328]|uniref:helix-turn-helix domain-containing protein n=1 Tax=Chryseobacterium sp. MYb328 TaxID=2745231 RepID=UPI0030A0760A